MRNSSVTTECNNNKSTNLPVHGALKLLASSLSLACLFPLLSSSDLHKTEGEKICKVYSSFLWRKDFLMYLLTLLQHCLHIGTWELDKHVSKTHPGFGCYN